MSKINLDKMRITDPVYYVGVQTGNFAEKDYHMTLITKADSKFWKAEPDEKPMRFSKKLAEEIQTCIELNGGTAYIVVSPGELVGQPFVNHSDK